MNPTFMKVMMYMDVLERYLFKCGVVLKAVVCSVVKLGCVILIGIFGILDKIIETPLSVPQYNSTAPYTKAPK